MDKFEQQRLEYLFEIEAIKCPLMGYIAPGVNLKLVTELGYKDQNGNKRRYYEEYKYPSQKYNNTRNLISANFRLNSYLVLEYPNNNQMSNMRNSIVVIKAYAMDDLIEKMKLFNSFFFKCYAIKNNEICLLSDKVKEIESYLSFNTSISFTPDIYVNNSAGRNEMGVRITINKNEYSFIISGETTWPELVYRISRCDLTLYGMVMAQSYLGYLPGMAVSTIGDNNYSSAARYAPSFEDPDDIVNKPESVGFNNSRFNRNNNEENKKKFLFGE